MPRSFPGSLLVSEDGIDKNYRLYERDGNEEFEYFVTRLVERVRPRQTKFGQKKSTKRISEIFTPSDEAYALLVLHNELELWTHQIKMKTTEGKSGRQLRGKKTFTDCNGGVGWNREGIRLMAKVMTQIRLRREQSISLENKMMKKWCDAERQAGSVRGRRAMKSSESWEEWDNNCIDVDTLKMLDSIDNEAEDGDDDGE